MNSKRLLRTFSSGLLAAAFVLTGCSIFAQQQGSQDQEAASSSHQDPEPGSPEYYEQLERERAQAVEQQAQRAQRCEPEDGEERFEFMPLGTYEASNDHGSGTMQMRDDYSLRINWTDHVSGQEKNVHADFMWTQQGIGEAIELCNVEAAPVGQIMEDVGDSSAVVLGIDEVNHSFRFDVPDIGEVQFTKVED